MHRCAHIDHKSADIGIHDGLAKWMHCQLWIYIDQFECCALLANRPMLKDSLVIFLAIGAFPSIENDIQLGEWLVRQDLLDFSFMTKAHCKA